MSYINFRVLENSELYPTHAFILVAIKQKDFRYLEEFYWLQETDNLLQLGYVTTIKVSKKNEGKTENLRLTPKGKKFLEDLETAEVSEEDELVFSWLKAHYLKMDKEIGNGAKTKRHIRDFRIQSGIEKNNLIRLCVAFLNDEDNMQYNIKMEYAFFKSPNAFSVRFDLEESRLYKYYLKRQAYFDSIFEEY